MIDELRGVLIIQKLNNQLSAIFNRSEIVKKCKIANAKISKDELKLLNKLGGAEKIEMNINRRVTLSNKSIGSTFSRSQSSGKLYQKRLNEIGVLRSRQKITILRNSFHPEMIRYASNKFFCTKNGELARQDSNTIWSPFMKSYNTMLKNSCVEEVKNIFQKREYPALSSS